ncbi:hypothetical protein HAX54_042730, partial [Datura stramonium]|nr:hypothetical protein [Datura stramonium]
EVSNITINHPIKDLGGMVKGIKVGIRSKVGPVRETIIKAVCIGGILMKVVPDAEMEITAIGTK